MRVLYLNHPEADYLGYGLYAGLCEVLGADRVIDFPSKRSYHGEIHRYPSPYAARWPPRAGDAEPGGCTEPFEYAIPTDTRAHDEAEVRAMLAAGAFSLTVCEGPRRTVLESLGRLPGLPRIVLADGEDYADLHLDHVQRFGIGLYLKRELLPGRAAQAPGSCHVHPFPFSTCLRRPPAAGPRDLDIHCAVGDTNDKRRAVRALVERLGQEGFSVCTTDSRTEHPGGGWWAPYVARLARARIVVAPRGWGQDTLRRWDAPAAGALCLQERLEILDPQPLQDGVHHVTYAPDGADLEHKLRRYLADEESRARIAEAGQAFVLQHHTARARAEQLLRWARRRWPELPAP